MGKLKMEAEMGMTQSQANEFQQPPRDVRGQGQTFLEPPEETRW